jgi:hypothetical protein
MTLDGVVVLVNVVGTSVVLPYSSPSRLQLYRVFSLINRNSTVLISAAFGAALVFLVYSPTRSLPGLEVRDVASNPNFAPL